MLEKQVKLIKGTAKNPVQELKWNTENSINPKEVRDRVVEKHKECIMRW